MVRCVSDGGWWSFEPSDVTNRCHSAGPPRTLPNLEAKKGPLEMGEMERLGNLIYNGIQIWLQHDIGMSSAVCCIDLPGKTTQKGHFQYQLRNSRLCSGRDENEIVSSACHFHFCTQQRYWHILAIRFDKPQTHAVHCPRCP